MTILLVTVAVLAGTGLIFGAILALASKVFQVETDPRIEELEATLPGANCGACGYPGCSGYAAAIAGGEAGVDRCPPGGAEVAAKLAQVMGVEAGEVALEIAFVNCRGRESLDRFTYEGIQDCLAAQLQGGGHKECASACLGFGDCVRACSFGAITIDENNLAVVDPEKCTGCKLCVAACPRNVISMIKADAHVQVACGSKEKGPLVRKICPQGCIGCRICVRECPQEAIAMDGNLAVIDHEKCNGCGICAEKCPTGTIVKVRS